MSKKNKRNNQEEATLKTTKYPLPIPDVQNMDDVGYYSDELLFDKMKRLELDRSHLLELRYDPAPWEVELAYLQREYQLRQTRKERHEAYVRELSQNDDNGYYNINFEVQSNSVKYVN